jgi:flagellar motor switch protein FliM
MKAANQLTDNENAANSHSVPVDPFAVDFFGGRIPHSDENGSVTEKEFDYKRNLKPHKKSDWYKNLPQISNSEAELSFLLQNLPENLTVNAAKLIRESIAHYTFRQPENVKFSVISVVETNIVSAANQLIEASPLFLKLACRPENSPALIALNTEFARSIIDLILGGKGLELGNPRSLSAIENAIIEFLVLNILGEINNFIGENLLCLQNVKTEMTAMFEPLERGAEVVVSLEIDDFKGILTLFMPQRFLNDLDRSQNPLLEKRTNGKKLSDFEKIVRKLDLRLQVGTTFLDADSLLFLEPDDIVLIEQPQINWNSENFGENLQICVGRGRNFRFRGFADNNEFNGELTFRIGEVLSEEVRRKFTPAKFKMDEKEIESAEETAVETDDQIVEELEEESAEEQISPTLENVQVALRVEIAGNKLSLRELQNLRAGQIIALGCRPTDPVRLVTDNNEEPVATGELVEIEGQLGVRLTKVFI